MGLLHNIILHACSCHKPLVWLGNFWECLNCILVFLFKGIEMGATASVSLPFNTQASDLKDSGSLETSISGRDHSEVMLLKNIEHNLIHTPHLRWMDFDAYYHFLPSWYAIHCHSHAFHQHAHRIKFPQGRCQDGKARSLKFAEL